MRVRATVAHIEPGSLTYRNEGEVFDHEGKIYKHVEKVSAEKAARLTAEEDEGGESVADVTVSQSV